jgi:hypothetical protein
LGRGGGEGGKPKRGRWEGGKGGELEWIVRTVFS